jgi:hypothetical protein
MQSEPRQQKKLAIKLIAIFGGAVIAFGMIYFLLGLVGATGLFIDGKKASFVECLYFSVVTITTLGYGDITPTGPSRFIASLEAIFGLVYVGYAISQVVSFKQESLINYLANDRLIQTYDLCLADLAEAKEMIADRRRAMQARHSVNTEEYFYFRLNPFFPSFKAMRSLMGYTAHIEAIGKASDLQERIERAAHHVEELAGFTRKLLNILNNEKIEWRTERSVMVLTELCEHIESFSVRFIKHTKYATVPYKGGGLYIDVVHRIAEDIIKKLAGPTIKYRAHR